MGNYIYKGDCRIHSLDGELAEAIIIGKVPDRENQYIAQYGDVRCIAIFNGFNNCYYVDDKYDIIGGGEQFAN